MEFSAAAFTFKVAFTQGQAFKTRREGVAGGVCRHLIGRGRSEELGDGSGAKNPALGAEKSEKFLTGPQEAGGGAGPEQHLLSCV